MKRHVELALCHLAQHEVNAADMVAENALAELVRISTDSLREDVRELAAKVISESPTFQQHLET